MFPAQREDPAELQQIIEQRMHGWSPVLLRMIRETSPETIQAFEFSAAARPKPWRTLNVTLLGDALHYMPPVGGMGGNAALHDAEMLCSTLLSVKQGKALLPSLHACEAAMVVSGFEAVSATLLYTRLAISRVPFMRTVARLFFRTCGAIAPLRRAVFSEPHAARSAGHWRNG
jgi:2-polyprenyl-6-methoxyphenol hydroxylase-like FAD-dependent oxidoreductase